MPLEGRWIAYLHTSRNGLSVGENFRQILGAEHISQSSLSEKSSAVMGVFDVGNTHRRITNTIVNNSVN